LRFESAVVWSDALLNEKKRARDTEFQRSGRLKWLSGLYTTPGLGKSVRFVGRLFRNRGVVFEEESPASQASIDAANSVECDALAACVAASATARE